MLTIHHVLWCVAFNCPLSLAKPANTIYRPLTAPTNVYFVITSKEHVLVITNISEKNANTTIPQSARVYLSFLYFPRKLSKFFLTSFNIRIFKIFLYEIDLRAGKPNVCQPVSHLEACCSKCELRTKTSTVSMKILWKGWLRKAFKNYWVNLVTVWKNQRLRQDFWPGQTEEWKQPWQERRREGVCWCEVLQTQVRK